MLHCGVTFQSPRCCFWHFFRDWCPRKLKNCVMACWDYLRDRSNGGCRKGFYNLQLHLEYLSFVVQLIEYSYSRLLEPIGPDTMWWVLLQFHSWSALNTCGLNQCAILCNKHIIQYTSINYRKQHLFLYTVLSFEVTLNFSPEGRKSII